MKQKEIPLVSDLTRGSQEEHLASELKAFYLTTGQIQNSRIRQWKK